MCDGYTAAELIVCEALELRPFELVRRALRKQAKPPGVDGPERPT